MVYGMKKKEVNAFKHYSLQIGLVDMSKFPPLASEMTILSIQMGSLTRDASTIVKRPEPIGIELPVNEKPKTSVPLLLTEKP